MVSEDTKQKVTLQSKTKTLKGSHSSYGKRGNDAKTHPSRQNIRGVLGVILVI
jgi:hypothetical protein